MINVRLLAYTQIAEGEPPVDPETLLACEKRLCNAPESWERILEDGEFKTEKRISSALKEQHMGLFEHLSFTFLVEGISRVESHQNVRHRMASFMQQSQRVVSMNDVSFVFPPSFPKEMKEEVSAYVNAGRELYNKLMEMGTPMDDARYVMPHGMETKFIVTMNGRSLMHFLKLRLGEHAQWEIKDVAMQMWTLVKDKFPVTFSDQFREFWE